VFCAGGGGGDCCEHDVIASAATIVSARLAARQFRMKFVITESMVVFMAAARRECNRPLVAASASPCQAERFL